MDMRKTAGLMLIIMLVLIFPSIGTAEENSAYALFSSETPKTGRMQAALTLGGTVEIKTEGGKTGWVLRPDDIQSSYLRCRIDDDYMFNLKSADTVEVAVTYFDDSYGGFSIYYDAQGGRRQAEFVQMRNTKQWKTHTFVLYDARFANGIDTDDFQIITNGTGKKADENGVMDASPYAVTISELRVSKSSLKSPYHITAQTGRAGNIFFEGEPVAFDISFASDAAGFGGEAVGCRVTDFDGNLVFSKNFAVSQKPETLVIPDLKYGIYYLEIAVTSPNVSQKKLVDFSYSRKADSVNERFGTNIHYDYEVYGKQDIIALSDLIQNAGYGFARNSVRWNQVEKTRGVYEMPENTMTAMRYNSKIGLKTLAILSCENWLYSGAPFLLDSDEQRRAYADFCSYAVGELSPYTHYFASPNEYNLIAGVNQPSHAAPFTRLVKAAYPAIMAADSEAFIVSGEIGRYEEEYNQDCYNMGILDVCDAFSMHLYDYVGGPEVNTVLPRIQAHYNTLKAANPDREAWVTENGWPARRLDNAAAAKSMGFADEIQQARWYARSFALNSDPNRIDKYFNYSFVDNDTGYYDYERMFGIVHAHDYRTPFAAKAAYITTAAFHDIVGNAEFQGNQTDAPYTYAYQFADADGGTIVCCWKHEWGSTAETYTYQSDKPYLEISDMFGNTKYIKNETGAYAVPYGIDPVYIKGVDAPVPQVAFSAKSLWTADGDAVDISVRLPEIAGGRLPMQIVLAAYDRSGNLVDTALRAIAADSDVLTVRYPLGSRPEVDSIKVMTLENITKLRPLTAAAELTHWGRDMGIACLQNGGTVAVSGTLPGLCAGESCMITVLRPEVQKDDFNAGHLLWQDMVETDKTGGYQFAFQLPDGEQSNRLYIQISSADYAGQWMFAVK